MKSKLLPYFIRLLIVVCILSVQQSDAQTPQFFVVGSSQSNNSFPFGNNGGTSSQVHLLYRPTDFNAMPPTGFIERIYFRGSNITQGTNNVTNLKIGLANTTQVTQAIGAWQPTT